VDLEFGVPELTILARDYAAALAGVYPEDWSNLNELAWSLLGDLEGYGMVKSEAAIRFVAGGSVLEMWLNDRLKRSAELWEVLSWATAAAMRLRRWFLELGQDGHILVKGWLTDGSEYHGERLLFNREEVEFDLRGGEIRVPELAGAPLIIRKARIALHNDITTDRRVAEQHFDYVMRIEDGSTKRKDDLQWGKDNAVRREDLRRFRREHPDPRLHRPGRPRLSR
jgi:hypothetical protein